MRDRFDPNQPIADLCRPLSAKDQPRQTHVGYSIQQMAQDAGQVQAGATPASSSPRPGTFRAGHKGRA